MDGDCADSVKCSSLVVYTRVFATPSTVYLLGLSKSLSSYTLHITSLSTDTGEAIHSGHIPSSISTSLLEAFILSDPKVPQTSPQVVWFEQGKIKSLELTPELKAKPAAVQGAVYKKIQDVSLSEHGHFVAIAEDGSGRVIKLTPDGLKVIWDYSDSVRPPFVFLPPASSIAASSPRSISLQRPRAPIRFTVEAWTSMGTRTLHACSGRTRSRRVLCRFAGRRY